MAEKRRGLGRGLGALIPSGPSSDARPVDVFFPDAPTSTSAAPTTPAPTDAPDTNRPSTETPTSAQPVKNQPAEDQPAAEQSGRDQSTADQSTVDHAGRDGASSTEASATAASATTATATAATKPFGRAPGTLATAFTKTAPAKTPSTSGSSTEISHTESSSTGTTATSIPRHDTGTPSSSGAGGVVGGMTDGGAAEVGATGSAAAEGTPTDNAPTDSTSTEGTSTEGAPTDGVTGGVSDDGLVPVPGATFAEVPVDSIRANPRQPRTVFDEDALAELVGSIREIGVLQPVVVRPVDDGDDVIRYELIMGERRWRATQEAGLETIPAIVRETEDADLLRDALLENLHRSQLNALEEAAAYQQLLDDFGCTHDELARRIHRSRPQITNTIRLLRLPPLVQRRVAAGVLSAGHARALLGLADPSAMERLAQRIVAEGLSVRATEEIVALGGGPEDRKQTRQPRPGERNAALDDLSARLSDRFDTRVKVQLGAKKGRLTIEFASVQDLNRLLEMVSPDDPGILR